jgi:hypothetical protein
MRVTVRSENSIDVHRVARYVPIVAHVRLPNFGRRRFGGGK